MTPSLGLSSKRPQTTPDGTDYLSSLPVEMVEEILRRLPLDDAVRTSGLAKPWRYRWAECPGLELVFTDEDPPASVDAVLARYACPVSVFELFVATETRAKVEGWLSTLATKGVRSLKLHFVVTHARDFGALPSQVFFCRDLTSLELQFCHIPPLPRSFQGFPNLAQLILDAVQFHERGEKTFEELISKSTLLSSLAILYPEIDGGQNEEWVIRARNLKIFDIRSAEDYGWMLEDLPSIEKGFIELEGHELPKILSGMNRAKELRVIFTDDVILELPSYFGYLKDLSLETPFTMSSAIVSIFRILRKAPNLENLSITILHEDDGSNEVLDMEFLHAQLNVGLFSTIQYVHINGIVGQSNEMWFIEFVLLKADKLQWLEVSVDAEESSMSADMVSSTLATYKRASPHAEIIINYFNGYYSDENDDE